MPCGRHRNPSGTVEKDVTIDVLYGYPFASCHDERIVARVGGRNHLRIAVDDGASLRPGKARLDIWNGRDHVYASMDGPLFLLPAGPSRTVLEQDAAFRKACANLIREREV